MRQIVFRVATAGILSIASASIAHSLPLSGLKPVIDGAGLVHQISDCHPQWATHHDSSLGRKVKHKHIGVGCKAKAAGGGGGSSGHCHMNAQRHSHPGSGNSNHRHRGSGCKVKILK